MGDAPTWEELVAGWDLGLYQAPILCGVVAGAVLGYLGIFVVLRRMVFVTVAVSQASGLGVALSFYAGIHLGLDVHPVIGAASLALLVTAVFAVDPRRLRLSREALLGFTYLACWAGAVLVGDRIAQEAHDIAGILFGSAVLVREIDLWLVLAAAGVVVLLHGVAFRGLLFAAFDPESARVQGLPVRALDLLGWVLIALTVAVTTRALGVLPVFAFAVLPAMAGLLLWDRLRWVVPTAIAVGALSGGLGYLLSFFGELPVGASQAALAVALLLLCLPARLLRRPRAARPVAGADTIPPPRVG